MEKRRIVCYFFFLWVVFTGCKDESSSQGDVYFKNKQYEKAIAAYDEYLTLKPKHVKSLYNRGRAYEELGNIEDALNDFNKVLEEDPNNVSALLSIGKDFLFRKSDAAKAYSFFDRAIKHDSNNSTAYSFRGKANQKLGNLQEAMNDYNGAISLDKENGDAYISRGTLRMHLNQRSAACNDFKVAKSLGIQSADGAMKKYCR